MGSDRVHPSPRGRLLNTPPGCYALSEGCKPWLPATWAAGDRKYEMPKTLEGKGCHLPVSTLSQNGKGPGVTATDIRCQCYLHFQCSPCSVPPFTGFCLISAYSDKWGDRWSRRLTHGVTMILQSHSAPFSPNESFSVCPTWGPRGTYLPAGTQRPWPPPSTGNQATSGAGPSAQG